MYKFNTNSFLPKSTTLEAQLVECFCVVLIQNLKVDSDYSFENHSALRNDDHGSLGWEL